MILSDNEPTRLYFEKGALFTDNSVESISERILEIRRRQSELKAEVVELKRQLVERDRRTLRRLLDVVTA
jgi:hypothetical protein